MRRSQHLTRAIFQDLVGDQSGQGAGESGMEGLVEIVHREKSWALFVPDECEHKKNVKGAFARIIGR